MTATRTAHTNLVVNGGPHFAAEPVRTDVPQSERKTTQSQPTSLLAELLRCRNPKHATLTLAAELCRCFGCRRAAVGLSHGRKKSCQLAAISDAPAFRRDASLARALEAAMDEAVLREGATIWPAGDDANRHALMAQQQLAQATGAEVVVSGPLRDSTGELVGAWVMLWDERSTRVPQSATLDPFVAPAADALRLLRAARPGFLRRTLDRFSAGRPPWKTLATMFLASAIAAPLVMPVPHRVRCDCELQPVTRRYVAAPFEGTLERILVEPGDVVRAGQLLGVLDGREIRWDLASTTADIHRAGKERDSHLATHNYAAAQLSKLEMERLELKSKLLQHRRENLELKSPVDGIVVAGDLKRAEGVRLTTGQTLFEIAPLDRMLVDLAVPEDDVRFLHTGQQVEITLDAHPGREWQGTIARVHPRSEIRDDENVFIAEVLLDNADGLLQPGMEGRAAAIGSKQPLGWCLFHKAWERTVLRWGW